MTSETASAPQNPAQALAYAQHVFDNYMDWYKTADSKAQILLGLDGAFLTFLTGSAFAKSKDATDLFSKFGIETWVLLGIMSAAMVVSMFSALACLWSRTYSRAELEKKFPPTKLESGHKHLYAAEVMWFFQMVDTLDKTAFQQQIAKVDDSFATQALASQIYELSGRITRKHFWVDVGFLGAAVSLTALLAAMITYVVRVA